ncbi:MAG: alpha-L-rhamnosidase [Clostridia bacterium]|nr:alpha-L-rhamnosidase [Clostridia bacterium]
MCNEILPRELGAAREDVRRRYFIDPKKIVKVWGDVKDAEALVGRDESQVLFYGTDPLCIMKNSGGAHAAILVDYGCEIHGDVRIVSGLTTNAKGEDITANVRVRFGESITEAITPTGERGSTNDHATRDTVIGISKWAAQETAETGFRYMYLEVLSDDAVVKIKSLTGVLIALDIKSVGSFVSSDERLNRIWQTAAYTVYLNMQEYLWDGVKRDRAVWFGDMNTEVEAALAIFGDTDVVRRSLEFGVKTTPLPNWMNGIPSYSFWWLVNMYRVYEYSGDVEFLKKHENYIKSLIMQIIDCILPNGEWSVKGRMATFIDWSTRDDDAAQVVGFKGLLAYTLEVAQLLLAVFGDGELIERCKASKKLLVDTAPAPVKQKIAAACLSLGALADAKEIDRDYIEPCGVSGYSTFMGYTILNAKALAGNVAGGVNACRDYWGAMLDLGATSFWEDFEIEWAQGTRIDEFPTENRPSAHGSFGKHCYIGLRLSLCHGWAAGPCPWLTKYVLGVNVDEVGMRTLRIKPALCDLEWLEGGVPTPYGEVKIRHEVREGKIYTSVDAPSEVKIVLDGCEPM